MKISAGLINVVIAISAGLLVLVGYFFSPIAFVRDELLHWAVILGAFALLIGVFNLLSVHWARMTRRQTGGVYSLVTIAAFLGTVVAVGFSSPTGPLSLWVLRYIQVPVESSLMAMLAITLAYASIRFFRRRSDVPALIWVTTVVLVLLGSAPLYFAAEFTWLSGLRDWLASVPAVAGARGLLLGVGLGATATGLRILMGVDRPYGG